MKIAKAESKKAKAESDAAAIAKAAEELQGPIPYEMALYQHSTIQKKIKIYEYINIEYNIALHITNLNSFIRVIMPS